MQRHEPRFAEHGLARSRACDHDAGHRPAHGPMRAVAVRTTWRAFMPRLLAAVIVWVFAVGERRSDVEGCVHRAAELGGHQQADEAQQSQQDRRGP